MTSLCIKNFVRSVAGVLNPVMSKPLSLDIISLLRARIIREQSSNKMASQRVPACLPFADGSFVFIVVVVSGAFTKLRKVTISFVIPVYPSVRPSSWNNSVPTGRIFVKFGIWIYIFRKYVQKNWSFINPLKPELNPICYLLALLGAHHFLHVSRIRVKLLTLRRLMSYIYIYGAPILDVSRSHTTTQHSR